LIIINSAAGLFVPRPQHMRLLRANTPVHLINIHKSLS